MCVCVCVRVCVRVCVCVFRGVRVCIQSNYIYSLLYSEVTYYTYIPSMPHTQQSNHLSPYVTNMRL